MRVKDVAAAAGVSVGTVSNVLNGRGSVAPEYVDRVNRAIQQLGFVRNDAARSLRSGRSRVIGLVIPDGENPFFTGIVRGAELQAEPNGGVVLVGHTHGQSDREVHYLDVFAEERARGVIVQVISSLDRRLSQLRERGTPTVVIAPEDPTWPTSTIAVDNVTGGVRAVRHLIETGRRRIAFVGGPLDVVGVRDRLDGARTALGNLATMEVIETDGTTMDAGREAGSVIAARSLARRPDAIFAANDLIGVGLLNAFAAARIQVPDEIAIVGYDDIPLARAVVPALTTVRQPTVEMGRAAVTMIDEERAGAAPRHILFDPELVVRQSTSDKRVGRS